MDGRKEKGRTEELIVKVQRHKGEIMREEERAKQEMKSFFRDLTDSIQSYESEIIKKFDEDILTFHEGAAKTINILSKLKNSAPEDSIQNAEEVLGCQVFDGTKVDRQKLKDLLREVYYLKIGAFHEDSKLHLPQMSESRVSAEEQMYSQSMMEKLQSERDYYQRREEELQQKLREIEFSRKGSNIRELSKSALEEKCSRWAIERLKEEKRVLVEKIGEASQQIIKQDGLLSEHQEEIRKLTLVINEMNGKSMVGNSSIKTNSMVVESQINHDRELELQGKVTQLTLELTNYMKSLEEVYRANQQYESELDQKVKQNENLKYQIADIKKENVMINNDYEANLRKKAVVQQQFNQLKKDYDEVSAKLQQERKSYKSVVEGLQLGEMQIKQSLKRMEAEKKAEVSSIEQKLIASQLEREKLLKKLDEVSSKSGDNTNHKQLLNDQITRLLKQNASMEKELHVKEQQLFEAKEDSRRLELEIKEQTKRSQTSKKQCSNLKKFCKQLEKQIAQLRNRLSATENLELKILQLDQNITILHNQFIKYKETSERRSSQHEKVITIMKQRFTVQLSSLLVDETKKLKKQKQSKFEIIQKYIEEMITFSSKTAQIKQLKEEVRELKDKQGSKQAKKRQKSNLQQTVSALQWGLWETNAKIFEERLKNQKELFEERLAEVIELQKKEEAIKNGLAEELQRQRAVVVEMKTKQKQEKAVQQSSKTTKQLQQKAERLQQEVKRIKARNKKLEIDFSDAQSELKTKKELNIGLKNQTKLKQDAIIQLNKQIDELKGELAKQQRNTRQMSNKQQLLKQSKESQKKIQEQYRQLLESLEDLTEKNKQLARQLAKKDDVIKQLSYIQQKQVKKKEDLLIKSLNNEITELKESVRKLKMDSDRKDEIIKINKNKMENRNKQNEELISKTEKQNDKISKQKENLQRKVESISSNLKREQMKSSNLSWTIKKIFEMCCQTPILSYEKQSSKAKPLTTQYYTNSSISPQTLKLGTPASNIKSYISCEGLDILNLRPEDIQECLGIDATTINKTDNRNESWSMTSPIVNKRREQQNKQLFMEGLQELERILTAKEMNTALLVDQFKKILER